MQNAVWTYKNTMGIFKQGRYLLFFTAMLNLILSIFLGNKYGLFGILFATFISRLLTNIWYDPYAVFKYGLEENVYWYFIKYIQYLLVLILTVILCLIICSYFKMSLYLNIILKLLICSIIPNIIFFLAFNNSSEFKYVLNKVVELKIKIKSILVNI